MIRYVMTAVLLCSTLAQAQGQNMREEMKKRMEEISRLMRESERLLLEITKVDRLVAKQQAILRELKKLEPPKQDKPSAQRKQKADDLKKKQADAARQLSELFDGQRQRGKRTVTELQALLQNWPKDQQQGSGQPKKKSKEQKEREKRLREKQKEQKQRSQPHKPRDEKDKFRDKKQRTKRPEDKKQANRAVHAIEAWIAKLPPKQQERISRGDLSDIPMRYRRLVREYTALRAKREAERDAEEDK